MAGAFAATADDPSAMFYNVAGLAYQRRMGAYAGATLITFNNEFRGSATAEFPGANSFAQYEDHMFTPPNVYAVVPVGENATLGFGTFTAFGLRTDWADGETFPGRFISQDANLKTVSMQPSFAMKHADGKFAWGVGLEYRTSHVTLERNTPRINPFTQRVIDVAHTRLDSEWSDGWGYNVGLMFRPNDMWSVGFQYRSDMDIDYEGEATITQIPTGNPQLDAIIARQLPPNQKISTSIAFPAFYSLGVSTRAIPNWNVEFDVVYNTWSRFEQIEVEFEQTPAINLHVIEDWEDSYSLRLGGTTAATENWDIYLGGVYDVTPQPTEAVGPLLPDADRVGITFGLGWHNDRWRVDVSDMVLIFMDRSTEDRNRDDFNGTFKTTANLLSINLGYNF